MKVTYETKPVAVKYFNMTHGKVNSSISHYMMRTWEERKRRL